MSEQAGPIEISLDQLDAEPHVIETLSLAATLGDMPCSAGAVLLAVAIHAGSAGSKAFEAFRSYLPERIDLDAGPTRKVGAVRLSRGLGESWTRIVWPGGTPGRLWGRDLITIALLAEHDPTLYEFCVDARIPADHLQDLWHGFLTEATGRESLPDVAANWRAAGIPEPADRASQPPADFLVTVPPAGQSSGLPVANWGAFTDETTGERREVLVHRRRLNTGDRIHVLAGERGKARLVAMAHVLAPPSDEAMVPTKQSFTRFLEIDWPSGPDHPTVDPDQLRAIDPETETWSWKSSGLRLRPEHAAAFQSFLEVLPEAAQTAGTEPSAADILRYAKTLSDLDHKNDWIGIRPDVEALSTLVAVDQVKPPLSVAIFGDWGSGKTFLLRKIQERVKILEQLGQQTRAAHESFDPDQPHYCGSILQIEFNAWHYTESNLWASLVNNIFERIYDALSRPPQAGEQKKPVDELFENFETARVARESAEQDTERLADELDEARTATQQATTAANRARGRLARSASSSVWTRVDRMLRGKDGQPAPELAHVAAAFKHFGFELDGATTSARTINDTLDRFRSVSGRAREVFGSLLATPEGAAGATVVAIVVGVATAIAIATDTPILSLGTALVGSLAWLAERAKKANEWLAGIESFSDWFAALQQRAEGERAAEIESARADLELKQAALLAAQQRQQEAARQEFRAKAELESLTARDQMRRFVNDRVTSRAYAQHLGLVSMIRSDFEELTRFMNREQETEEIELVQRIEAATLDKIPTIDRIVLYIDDLDRCQPERVVEVLEAIHLLLAFRLFIVVVAFDPRWVIESLTQKYVHLGRAQARNHVPSAAGGGYHSAATAHDYLEKIFHIPFWVKPMSPVACEKLIAGYLDLRHGDDGEQTKAQRDRQDELFHSLETVDVEDLPRADAGAPTPVATGGDEPGAAPAPAPEIDQPAAEVLKAEKSRRRVEESIAAAAHIETVVITEDEETFIRRLSPFLGNSPRRIKRFANSYRLIKSGLSRAEADRMARSEDHRIVLAFLAVVTGAPNYAPGIFVEILKRRGAQKLDLKPLADALTVGNDPAHQCDILNAKGALSLIEGMTISREQVELWVPRVIRHAYRMIPGSLPIEGEARA